MFSSVTPGSSSGQPKRFAFARRGYSPTGGAEAYLQRFAHALREQGHEAVLYTTPEWPSYDWAGGEVRPIDTRSPRTFADALRDRPEAEGEYLFSLERLWHCDAYRAGDGVHRVWLDRRREIEPAYRSWFRFLNRKHRDLLALEERLFSDEGAGVVVANSQMVKDEIIATYGYPEKRIEVIYNGLPKPKPTGEDERRRRRAELGISEKTHVILFAGSGWERKGLAYAIRALNEARLPDTLLLVAGRGKPAAMPASTRVRYLGPVCGMAGWYAMADLFVLPTFYDPFSNASLEAMAQGLPVITTRYNGVGEVLTPGVEGEVIDDPRNLPALVQAFRDWSDRSRCLAARPDLLAKASRFTIEENLRATLALLQRQETRLPSNVS